MELHLVRHAIAFDSDPHRWPDDSLRPLSPEGEERFRRAAQGLGRLVPTVEVVLASPYVRAWRTAELMAEEAGWPQPVRCEELGADRPAAEAVGALRRHGAAETLAMVGHEPNLSELASLLLTRSAWQAAIDMKKGGAICLRFDGEAQPGEASLVWLLTPMILRALRS
jgi:phosphohistidine phosphatase